MRDSDWFGRSSISREQDWRVPFDVWLTKEGICELVDRVKVRLDGLDWKEIFPEKADDVLRAYVFLTLDRMVGVTFSQFWMDDWNLASRTVYDALRSEICFLSERRGVEMSTLAVPFRASPVGVNEQSLIASITKESFSAFVREFWEAIPGTGKLYWNWHIDVMCRELQEAAERVFLELPRTHDLIVNISPGSTKSTIFSILFMPWVWTRMANARFLFCTHTESLALDLSLRSRFVIKSEKYQACFPDIQISKEQDAKGHFLNTLGGERMTCTVAGKSPMGQHAHFIIIDDPIDPKKALSDVELKIAENFIRDQLPSRKVSKAASFTGMVMQRLAEHDPTGVMLEDARQPDAFPVRHVCLPAEIEDDKTLVLPLHLREKYVDNLMDPVRLSRQVLADYRSKMSEYAFSGQFRQSPVKPGGQMFKDFYFNQRVKAAPYNAKRIWYWDRACLVGGTLVETSTGPRRIDEIRAGELVLTRLGFKRVKRAWRTKFTDDLITVTFSNGASITGTRDHLVWTENDGWVELDSVHCGHYCLVSPTQPRAPQCAASTVSRHSPTPKLSSLAESTTPVGLESATSRPPAGTRRRSVTTPTLSTGRSGGPTTGPSPPDTTSTTRTAIGTTTTLATWTACPGPNTTASTAASSSGTRRRRRAVFAGRTCEEAGGTPSTELACARTAAGSLSLGGQPPQSSAPPSAATGAERMIAGRHARSAGPSSEAAPTAGPARRSVQNEIGWPTAPGVGNGSRRRVERSSPVALAVEPNGRGPTPVYDLEVEDAHEFFANGILVHNSTQDGGCYTAGVLMAKDPQGNFYVENVIHGQWEPDERNQRIKAAALKTRVKYGPNNVPAVYVEAEGGSSGRDSFKGLARVLAGFVVREQQVSKMGDKEHRAEPWSTQLAAGNVYLVENESEPWDVNGFVKEHTQFPRGRLKDRVDASSGGYSILANSSSVPGIRVLTVRPKKDNQLKVVLASPPQLAGLILEGKSLLVRISDPPFDGQGGPSRPTLPPLEHGILQLLSALHLEFLPLDPRDHLDRWEEPVEPYGKRIEELLLSPEVGKKLWSFLLRKRDFPVDTFVFADENRSRLESVALAVADSLRLGRGVLYDPAQEDAGREGRSDYWKSRKPPVPFVYETIKAARSSVL